MGYVLSPDTTHCLLWHANDRMTVINDKGKSKSLSMGKGEVLGIGLDNEAVIYVQNVQKWPLIPGYSEIIRSRFTYDGDQILIQVPGESQRLEIKLDDRVHYRIAVEDMGSQTNVFIAHCDGKVEEVTFSR
jgi:hypothetical protein